MFLKVAILLMIVALLFLMSCTVSVRVDCKELKRLSQDLDQMSHDIVMLQDGLKNHRWSDPAQIKPWTQDLEELRKTYTEKATKYNLVMKSSGYRCSELPKEYLIPGGPWSGQ